MITLKILSLYSNIDVSREIEAALAPVDGLSVDSRNDDIAEVLAGIGVKQQPDVLILEIDEGQVNIADIERDLARIAQTASVIVTHKTADVEMMRSLMRLGIRDFLPQPINKQELVNLITDLLSEKRTRVMDDRGSLASVYTLLNAKGGSGGSTVAVNTAAWLAKKHNLKVVLVDLDIQLGVIDLFLDLHAKSNIYDALVQAHRVDSVFLKSLVTHHESGLDVLTSPSQLTSISDISAADVKRILDAAAENYDIVIVDLPKVFSAWTLEVLKHSEKVFLVLQNSIAATRDAKVILDNLPKQGVRHSSFELINNRAEAAMGAVSATELSETLKVPTMHNVRSDYKAAINAQNQGKLIADVAPSSKLQKDIESFSQYLAGMSRGVEQGGAESKKSFWAKLKGNG